MSREPQDEEFFVGYHPTHPSADRRFMLRLGIGLTAASAGLAAGLGALQRTTRGGTWDPADRTWHGRLFADPFPVLRTRDVDGGVSSLWLVCPGKCGVRATARAWEGRLVRLRGSLLSRNGFHMLSAADDAAWITPADPTEFASPGDLRLDRYTDRGAIDLAGEILDAKCFAGAMNPAEGKAHKACASLCIRGGIPPALYLRDVHGRTRMLLLVDADGSAHDPAPLLPLVADPVRVRGRVLQRADTLFLAAPITAFRRRDA